MEMKTKKVFYYRVQVGQNIKDICSMFEICKDSVLRNNNEIELYAGEWIRIMKNDYKIHIVKPTENIQTISKLYNTKIEDLIKYNNLVCDKLFIGQMIKVIDKKKDASLY